MWRNHRATIAETCRTLRSRDPAIANEARTIDSKLLSRGFGTRIVSNQHPD